MSLFSEIESLVKTLPRDVRLAKELQSPNVEDELSIKTAIVGFSYSSKTQNWATEHFNMLLRRLELDYDQDELKEYGEGSETVRLYAALAFGFLLGKLEARQISEQEFRVADAQIPGIVMLHLGTLLSYSI